MFTSDELFDLRVYLARAHEVACELTYATNQGIRESLDKKLDAYLNDIMDMYDDAEETD